MESEKRDTILKSGEKAEAELGQAQPKMGISFGFFGPFELASSFFFYIFRINFIYFWAQRDNWVS